MRCLRRFRSLAWAFKCWAACSALCRHPAGRSRGPELGGSAPTVSKSTVFRRGFLTNISNPKSALFFGSVFAEPFLAAPGVALQVSAVAMIVVNALCWHTLLAYFFLRPRVRAGYARSRSTANRVASALLGALGVGLLVSALPKAQS